MINEIRVGNWVEHNSNWCYRKNLHQFQWSERDWHALGECTMFIENILPIHTTGEWLEKLNFQYDFHNGLWELMDDIEFTVDLKQKTVSWINQIYDKSYCHHPLPESVHLLQNLYFYLSGEELKYIDDI